VSTFPGPVVVRVTDANGLAYPNAPLAATASAGGTVEPAAAVTDAQGQATFRWTPGSLSASRLQVEVKGLDPAVTLTLATGSAVPVVTAVVNAASYAQGVAAGGLATILGTGLTQGSDPQVLLNDLPVRLLYAGATQINFYVPAEARLGPGTLTVIAGGERASAGVTVSAIQPGIFPGAVLRAGTAVSAVTTPVRAGDYIEIYCTGLGPTRSAGGLQQTTVAPTVFIGAIPVTPVFSGLTGIPGLYQVNVQVPAGTGTGLQTVLISANLFHSNEIQIAVQ
jgi:uncharacterized protein (TIGR03437 family)